MKRIGQIFRVNLKWDILKIDPFKMLYWLGWFIEKIILECPIKINFQGKGLTFFITLNLENLLFFSKTFITKEKVDFFQSF